MMKMKIYNEIDDDDEDDDDGDGDDVTNSLKKNKIKE